MITAYSEITDKNFEVVFSAHETGSTKEEAELAVEKKAAQWIRENPSIRIEDILVYVPHRHSYNITRKDLLKKWRKGEA